MFPNSLGPFGRKQYTTIRQIFPICVMFMTHKSNITPRVTCVSEINDVIHSSTAVSEVLQN